MLASTLPQSQSAVAAWSRYDALELRLTAPVSERMLDLAGLRPGARVLDIATGRGEPALRAAARVAPDGHVLGTDVSPDMLSFARARAAAESANNLTLVVTDGHTLAGVAEQAFDAALCRWGLMFFDDPITALREIRRRLVPDGVFVAAMWAAPDRVPWWSLPHDTLARHADLEPIRLDAPGPFRYASPEAFQRALAATGLRSAHEEELDTVLIEADTPLGLVEWARAFGLPRELRGQSQAVQSRWHEDMLVEAESYRTPEGKYRLGGTTRLVVARPA